jgi:predicted acylesterase/phospholipase RssA
MRRLGLALSGGGFRATLYHLGVVRFLKDAGALSQVTDIASVSGGSILAAHLALNWERYTGDDEQFAEAASEVVKFVQLDVRNRIVRRLPLQIPLRLLAKLTRLKSRRFTPNAILEQYYETFLYGDRCLYELPEEPRLHVLTTNVSNGKLSLFNREGLYIQQRGEAGASTYQYIPGQMASLPRVVGASSAFPGFFPPVEITAADLGVREGQFPSESFTDGGVYDNLGIRAFSWLRQQAHDFDQILVSDAGKPFQILTDASLGLVGQSVRASDILWDRVWQLERDNFGEQGGFAFIPITETVDLAEDPTALHPVIQAEVQSIRTDLDHFSTLEINSLVQHGYQVARKVYRRVAELEDDELFKAPPWAPVVDADSASDDSVRTSGCGPSPVTRISRQLRQSGRRRVWSTLFDPRDWTSYLYAAIAFLVLLYLPLQVYKLYDQARTHESVLESIAKGDPDFRRILALVDADPTKDWAGVEVAEKQMATQVDYQGIEVLSHNRIIDARRWYPEESTIEQQGNIYLHDRVSLRMLDSYTGDKQVILRYPVPISMQSIEFRHGDSQLQGTISRVSEPVETLGEQRTLYEVEYDLSSVPIGEAVDVELEMLAQLPVTASRTRFLTELKTDLVSVWLLFPVDRPYRTYNLVRYPADRSEAPEIVDARFTIDHPYGSLIGWSVVNPQLDSVYECRWTTE